MISIWTEHVKVFQNEFLYRFTIASRFDIFLDFNMLRQLYWMIVWTSALQT